MLDDAEPCCVSTTALPVVSPLSSRRTILIVTADGNLGGAAVRILEQEAYDVIFARHAGHAFLAALTRTRIDILISELALDDMTGEALAATLRRHHPSMQSLFIADHATAMPGPLLVRPFTRDELLGQLQEIAPATSQAF